MTMLSQTIKVRRKQLKLTQVQLASKAGITVRALGSYETEYRTPPYQWKMCC